MRWLSGSLSIRLFLIVLGGVILAITISNVWHHRDRMRFVEEFRERNAIEHLADAIRMLAVLSAEQRSAALQALPSDSWLINFDSGDWERREAPPVLERLEQGLGNSALVKGAWLERSQQCRDETPDCPASIVVNAGFADGQAIWLGYRTHSQDRLRPPLWVWLLNRYLLVVGVMAVVAWIVVRIALRPLQKMAEATERFGCDISHPPIEETGPCEVKQAAQAFNTMQRQIRGYMAERTQILSAVTHDLKTPMTRMRLRLESCSDEALKDKLQADLAAMQSLVEEGLELAHSMETTETPQPVDLDALLQSLCDDAVETGLDVSYQAADAQNIVAMGQPNALRRIFENIISNAIKYGQYARVCLERQGEKACVRISDDGPGIPDEYLEAVLKPFFRLESSRSRDTGGTGLGLAIAVNLLRAQKGEMGLRNLPQGGLEVSVRMPIALPREHHAIASRHPAQKIQKER